jgi:hypothetical protein
MQRGKASLRRSSLSGESQRKKEKICLHVQSPRKLSLISESSLSVVKQPQPVRCVSSHNIEEFEEALHLYVLELVAIRSSPSQEPVGSRTIMEPVAIVTRLIFSAPLYLLT